MMQKDGSAYYVSRSDQILDLFRAHAEAWRPHLASRWGEAFAEETIRRAREILESLLPQLPYIGGDENPMTRHLMRSSTSLALYKAMDTAGRSAEETGRVIYEAVKESVRDLPATSPPTEAELAERRQQALASQEHRFPGGWVWTFVEAHGEDFAFGYDSRECRTQKLYQAHGAEEFLPFYCYLDFVTYRTSGWSFRRTKTLSEGYEKCDFRFYTGGQTQKGWPPPFGEERDE